MNKYWNVLKYPLLILLMVVNIASKKIEEPKQNKKVFKLVYLKSEMPHNLSEEKLNLEEIPRMQELYRVADFYLGKFAVFFIAIKIEESGADKKPSWLAVTHNNLTGMRYPRKRETYAIAATESNYAIYRNWFESMLDFKIYMENMEKSFIKKHNREFEDEYEMLNYLYNYFNHFEKWYKDMRFLIPYVKKHYVKNHQSESKQDDVLIFEYL